MGKTITMIFGWVFLVIGILGFINNPIIGANGLFVTDMTHNLLHLISGIIFLWVAYSALLKSGGLLKIFGIIYLLIALLGFFSSDKILGLIRANNADNWLHVVLAIILIWAGWMGGKSNAPTAMPMGGQQM